jgi:hypothetical protein
MLNANQLRSYVIKPALLPLDLWSPEAEDLLVMICAHESLGGTYVAQIGGPALGIYQMEPDTHNSIWSDDLRSRRDMYRILAGKLLLSCNFGHQPPAEEMVTNFKYATIMARIFFLRFLEPIPSTVPALGMYAKHFWNTKKGKATAQEYVDDFQWFTKKK